MNDKAQKKTIFLQRAVTIEKMARDGLFDPRSLSRVRTMMSEIHAELDAQGMLHGHDDGIAVYVRRGKALFQALASHGASQTPIHRIDIDR